MGKLALVLSGGGARGAYEAGVIHYLRTGLPKDVASKVFDIQCGSSAGAINTAAMVSMAEDPLRQGSRIKELWLSLKQDDIYNRDFSAATHFIFSSLGGILRNLTTFDPFKLGRGKGPHFTSFLDTSPLKKFLNQNVSWSQIEKNINSGLVDAVTVTATNTRTGYGELFVQKNSEIEYTGDYKANMVDLKADHVLASAAIPIIFPTVKIGKSYYTDGGLRVFTPTSPAIQLGADRIVVVGLRHQPSLKEREEYEAKEMKSPPSLAELMGRIMNGLFLDRVQFDLEQLHRVNKIIEWSEKVYGKDYLEKINRQIQKECGVEKKGGRRVEESFTKDLCPRGLKNIQAVEILPSEFISQIFGRWFNKKRKGGFKFSTLEKFLTRILDVDTEGAIELLSYLTFANDYLQELIDLGYEDAKKNRNRLIEIMREE